MQAYIEKGIAPQSPIRRIGAALALIAAMLLLTAGDWPSYLHDGPRTAASGDETILSPSNAGQLTKLWSFRTSGVIAASAAVVGGVVYIGSWDGYEYALDAATGAVKWKTYLGITSASGCNPPAAGVTSGAAVQNGVVYVGGGDAYWYALDAATGAVLWKVYTGDNSAAGGHYNWASPLIANGYAYIGVASFGDCPLVQGQLLQVSLSTHQIVNTYNFVPNGTIGGGVWTSPSIDPATNTIYVTTGTIVNYATQPQAQAIVALDGSTLALKGAWQIPQAQTVGDSDWGTTPLVFDDATGDHLVAAADKNGYLYAFDRANVTNGPVWQRRIGNGGSCPQCGDGMASSGAFGAGHLYFASGAASIGSVGYPGSVRALDPATGSFLWEHGAPGVVIPALAYANGLVIDGAGPTLEVLDASTGNLLYSYKAGATLYGAPSVSNGRIFVGSVDGDLYAFGLPSEAGNPTPTGTPPPAPGPGAFNLAGAYNNAGISDDGAPGSANFDGVGYSYSAQTLQGAGLAQGQVLVYNGVVFQWPNAAPGTPDNVAAQGQTVSLSTPVGGTALAFLGAASNGPSTGTGTITYSDGSTQSFTLSLSDWALGADSAQPVAGNSIVATMPYRNGGAYGQQTIRTNVFYTAVPLQAGKAVAGVTLPNQANLHIFAMSVANAGAATTPTASPTATQTPTRTPTATATNTPPATATASPSPAPTGAVAFDLSSAANNAGVSDDANPGAANFDNVGYSYSAQALLVAGVAPGQVITAGGVAFRWPNAAPGAVNNVTAQGQTLALGTPATGTALAFLGAADHGPSTGAGTIRYSDGSTQGFSLTLSDWALNGGGGQLVAGNTIAATTPYRNGGGGRQTMPVDLFYAAVPLQAGKAVASVTLPSGANQGAIHIFAMAVTSPSSPPTTTTPTSTPTATQTPTSSSTPTATATATGTPTATAATSAGSFNLLSAANNAGVSDDANPGAANFDNVGYSYSAQALLAAGVAPGQTVAVNGAAFQWPNRPPGAADDVTAQGQTLALGTPATGTALAFLGAADHGPSTGAGTIRYSDGSTQGFSLTLSDWTLNAGASQPAAGNTIAATTPYRNGGGGRQAVQTDLFYAAVPLQAGKAVASVTLPSGVNQGAIHIFAMTVS